MIKLIHAAVLLTIVSFSSAANAEYIIKIGQYKSKSDSGSGSAVDEVPDEELITEPETDEPDELDELEPDPTDPEPDDPEPAPSGPTIEEVNQMILSQANFTGKVSGNIAGYQGLGNIWVNDGIIAGFSNYPIVESWTIVLRSSTGSYLVMTDFIDNPWTTQTSFGSKNAYLNGVSISNISGLSERILTEFGSDAVLKYSWSGTQKGIELSGDIYTFKNPAFDIGRSWK